MSPIPPTTGSRYSSRPSEGRCATLTSVRRGIPHPATSCQARKKFMTHVASTSVGIRRRSLSTRLLTGFAFLSLLTGMAGGAGILFVREIRSSVEALTGTASPLLGNVLHLVDGLHLGGVGGGGRRRARQHR